MQQVQVLVPTEGEDNFKVVVTRVYNQRQRILTELNQAPKVSLNGIKTVSIQD